ncbi:MAG TPA: hypothetical protein VGD99_02615 [Anaerolineae bacterium]|jgi:CubicO group peptidase (beta-lactamase class C family)
MMTLLTGLVLAAVHLAHPPAMAVSGAVAVPDFEMIDKFVEAEMQAQHIPGLALGIVQGDQIVHLMVSGLVALGWGILRTVWITFALRESNATSAAGTPVTV